MIDKSYQPEKDRSNEINKKAGKKWRNRFDRSR